MGGLAFLQLAWRCAGLVWTDDGHDGCFNAGAQAAQLALGFVVARVQGVRFTREAFVEVIPCLSHGLPHRCVEGAMLRGEVQILLGDGVVLRGVSSLLLCLVARQLEPDGLIERRELPQAVGRTGHEVNWAHAVGICLDDPASLRGLPVFLLGAALSLCAWLVTGAARHVVTWCVYGVG